MASLAPLQAIAVGLDERQRACLLAAYVQDQRREAGNRSPGGCRPANAAASSTATSGQSAASDRSRQKLALFPCEAAIRLISHAENQTIAE